MAFKTPETFEDRVAEVIRLGISSELERLVKESMAEFERRLREQAAGIMIVFARTAEYEVSPGSVKVTFIMKGRDGEGE